MKKLSGITVAMTTPFFEDGGVDFEAVAALTNMLIEKGVQCLYPGGTTGEMLRMSLEERKKQAEVVVKTAAGRVPVFIHCGATNEDEVIALARYSEAIGADGIGVVTPQFFGLNHREMVEFFVRVAGSVSPDFPVYLYNIPQCAANDITAAACREIAERCPNVVGIKYSFADINRTMDYLRIRDFDFSVMHGCDRVYAAFKALGCDGTVSGCAGVFPEPFVAVNAAIEKGDWEAAKLHQRQAARVVDILHAGANMAYFKAALTLRGLNGGHMRKPQLDLPQAEIDALKADLEAYCAETGYSLKA